MVGYCVPRTESSTFSPHLLPKRREYACPHGKELEITHLPVNSRTDATRACCTTVKRNKLLHTTTGLSLRHRVHKRCQTHKSASYRTHLYEVQKQSSGLEVRGEVIWVGSQRRGPFGELEPAGYLLGVLIGVAC